MQIYYFIFYFFIYGFLGWCTEVVFATVKQRRFVNRGFLNGPI
ncbi:MAG: putative ABC transporter permease, partial [Lachnospiraceae bacterium]|nr:putative ABC transporter permease [Lachnospiraceae bacterium]